MVTEHWKNCHRTWLDSRAYKRPPNEGGTNSKNQRRKPDREREREIEHKGMEVRIRRKGFLGFLERGEEGVEGGT